MTIYIDVVLIENLCMNYIILFATGFIMKIKIHHLRMILSSLIGSVYAIVAYTKMVSLSSNIFLKILLSVCMVYIAFKPKKLNLLFKCIVMFYLVSFVFGGCAFALLYFLKPEDIFMINGVYVGTYPFKIILLGVIVGFTIIHIAFKMIKNKIEKKSIIYDIIIKWGDKTIKMKAMLDTGNRLKEPITGSPVIVVEKDKLKELLPESILNNIEKVIGGDWNCDEYNIDYKSRLRLIPFNSIGKQNGMLLGFKVDEVKVMNEIEEIINKNVIVCLYEQKLSRKNSYSALIGLDMIERREEHEFITNIKI